MRRFLFVALATCSAAASAPVQAQGGDRGAFLYSNCANCHGTNGRSVGGMPALAGQSRESIAKTMKDFKTGARPATIMHQIAKGYSDEQIDAIAAFLASQKAK